MHPNFTHSADKGEYRKFNRERALGAALSVGRPVFPCTRKSVPLCGKGGFHNASTDEGRIRGWWRQFPWAGIAIPTGQASATADREPVISIDVDVKNGKRGPETLAKLEAEYGKLPRTRTHRTKSGGYQLILSIPRGFETILAVEPFGSGVDIKGDGGLIQIPPSPGYTVEGDAPIAPVPEAWLEAVRRPAPKERKPARKRTRRSRAAVEGEPIPDGQRNVTLFFAALDRKDAGEEHAAVLEHILAVNDARCRPPLDQAEVEKIANSAMQYPVRSGRGSPELDEAVGEMIRHWWAFRWKGLGGQSDRDVMWALLGLASRYGRLNRDGSVDISAAVRTLALAAGVSYVTVSRSVAASLRETGWVTERIPGAGPRDGATWRLHTPSRGANTKRGTYRSAGVLAPRETPDALPEETARWRHRGLVTKGPGAAEDLLEVCGPMTREEVAEFFGWRNPYELESRYLRLLVRRGLAELREDYADGIGRYALVENHAERVQEVKATRYAVLLKGERWEQDPLTGAWEWSPDVYGRLLSEDEREEEQERKHRENREDHRAELIRRELAGDETDEADYGEFEELQPVSMEMRHASRAGRMLLARGWTRNRREWTNPETGQVASIAGAMEQLKEDTA